MTEPLTQLERKFTVPDVSHVGNIFIYWIGSTGLSRYKSLKLSGSEIFSGFTVTGSVNLSLSEILTQNYKCMV